MSKSDYLDLTDVELRALYKAWEDKELRRMRWGCYLVSILCTVLSLCFRGHKLPKQFNAEDFMPGTQKNREPQTTQHLAAVAEALASTGWGKMIDPNEAKN